MVWDPEQGIDHHIRFSEILARAAEERAAPRKLGPYVTVSRQVGSGGSRIARLLGTELGWTVLDRELVEHLAEKLEVSPQMLELMDETSSNWFRDTVLSLFEPRLMEQHAYVTMLGKVMLLAAYNGDVVIVGRGANFLLPPENRLRVLVTAPREARLREIQERYHLEARAAERRLGELDESRADFVRRNFHQDVDDSNHYDLAVSSAAFGIEGSVKVIREALNRLQRTGSPEGSRQLVTR